MEDMNGTNVEAMVVEGLAALGEFEKTGDRGGFKDWLDKYGDEVEEIKSDYGLRMERNR